MRLNLKLLIALGLTSAFITACEQGSSPSPASSPSQESEIKFSSNAAFAINQSISISDCTFNNDSVPNGTSVTAYQNSAVAYGESCVAETRTCDNGLLSGSYSYSSCSVDTPASCLFNGQTIPHGSTIEAFNVSSVELGGECIGEMRTCDNGVLSGSNPYATCGIHLPASCVFNGQTIPSGSSVSAYLNSSVSYGEQCSVETRYCLEGALSGSNQYASCVVDQPASCLFNGQTIAHGQNIVAYLNSTESFGSTCQQEVRVCDNGVLSGFNQYASCVADQPASCLFNGQTIPHGDSITAYLTSNTNASELCTAEERVCNNGELGGSYQFASCSIDQAASCLFNGLTIAHGSSVKAFSSSSVNFGESCASENRECVNGVLSGSNPYASCEVGSAASCLFNGQTIAHGQSVIAYETSIVSEDSQCKSESQTCTNGSLSGSFKYSSCTEPGEEDESSDNHKEKFCKKQRVEKHESHHEHKSHQHTSHEHMSKHEDNGLHLGWYKHKHKEHFDCGKHLGWYNEKKKKAHQCGSKENTHQNQEKDHDKNKKR